MHTPFYPAAESFSRRLGLDCTALPPIPAWYIFSHSGFTGPFPSFEEVTAYLADPCCDPLFNTERIVEVTEVHFKALVATVNAFFDSTDALAAVESVDNFSNALLAASDEDLETELRARRRVESMMKFHMKNPMTAFFIGGDGLPMKEFFGAGTS